MTALQLAVVLGAIIIAGSSGLLMFNAVLRSEFEGVLDRRSVARGSGGLGGFGEYGPVELRHNALEMDFDRWAGLKRLIDCVTSIALLLFFMPIILLTAIAIKLNSKGPVLYRQKRIGYRGRNFEVFKFRSMAVDAEKDGPQYAATNDHRVTWVGRWIRRTRIDEIPQTINVLRGEMSFVGPRPERPEFVVELEKAIPLYHIRHAMKPGITGWAQVKYEYAASVEGAREKLRYDLFYIRNFSPLLDIVIILMTVRVALFGIGSR